MAEGSITIGVHLIAKDEAGRLPRCLDSVSEWASQIVLVDTGSSDRTQEIARAYGAVVVSHVWENDFSGARNEGLKRADTDWVLVLDADEELAEGGEGLHAELAGATADRYSVRMEHRLGPRPEEAVLSRAVRLFRAGKYRYEGRVHEQLARIEMAGDLEEAIAAPEEGLSELRLLHYGYMPEEMARKGTAERNKRLLEREAADSPEDSFVAYNLAVAYVQSGERARALRLFEKALNLADPNAPYRPTLVRDYAETALNLDEGDKAVDLLASESKKYPDYPDLALLQGKALQAQGRLPEASRAYEAAASCRPERMEAYICLAGAGSYRPWTALGDVARMRGEAAKADRLYSAAIVAAPSYRPAWQGWVEAMRELGMSYGEVRDRIEATVKLSSLTDGAKREAALALADAGGYEEALELVRTMNTSFDRELACFCLAVLGRHEEAAMEVRQALAEREGKKQGESVGRNMVEIALLGIWNGHTEEGPDWLLSAIPETDREAARKLSALVRRREKEGEVNGGGEVRELAFRLSDRALTLRLPDLAWILAEMSGESELSFAKRLFRRGYSLRGADRLLRLMQRGELDEGGYLLLGETLFGKGHYSTAAAVFEEALASWPEMMPARLGVTECYLRMAVSVADEGLRRNPGHPRLSRERGRLEESLRLLAGLPWRTPWNGAERSNSDG
ncbi:TPR domain-containing glycosyltransferase [Cohnella endophytica]|nr:TPR domain-containing glycosyltransferase [Cohnella endophytica]